MEAILSVKITQHGSCLGGQVDPTWRLSWGSEGPNMEAILSVKITQHGSCLGGQVDPTWRLSWRSK